MNLFSTKTPRKHTAGDGAGAARKVAPGGIEFDEIMTEFRRINTREAQAVFADRWLAIAASKFNHAWPMIYQMLQLVEKEEIYKVPRNLSGAAGPGAPSQFPKGFETFQQYFEARVKQPRTSAK